MSVVMLRLPRRTFLSYQHMYHAGNAADLHKHSVLAGCLSALLAAEGPAARLWYADTHAGRGVYNVTSPEARKTGDAARGYLRAAELDLPAPLRHAVAATRARYAAQLGSPASDDAGPPCVYPGSPAVADALLPAASRMFLFERHPAEYRALRRYFAPVRRAVVEQADGPARLLALGSAHREWRQAFSAVRGFVLVDPSYESKTELADTAAAVHALARALPLAAILVWYPLLPPAVGKDSRALCEPLQRAFPALHRDEVLCVLSLLLLLSWQRSLVLT